MNITRLLCIIACSNSLVSCVVTGQQKVAFTFRDRHTLKPVEGMSVRIDWGDERPWRLAIPYTREGLTDSRGMVVFDRLSEYRWSIKACRPSCQIGTLDFTIDAVHGVCFDCGRSKNMIESGRMVIDRDRFSPKGPAPNMVMTAREIYKDGSGKNAVADVLIDGVFNINRKAHYEHVMIRDD